MCGLAGSAFLCGSETQLSRDFLARSDCSALARRGDIRCANTARTTDGKATCHLLQFWYPTTDDRDQARPPYAVAGTQTTLNGYITNYRDLRREVERTSTFAFSTSSDIELVAAAYATYGIDGLGLLEGFFAIAIFDPATARLILARDAFGARPLYTYCAESKGEFFFASTLAAMVDLLPEVSWRPSPQYIRSYFRNHASASMRLAPIEQINPVLPGEVLVVDLGGAEISSEVYSTESPLCTHRDTVFVDSPIHEEVAGIIRENVVASIEMPSSRKPALLFSGGIDSALLLSLYCATCAERASDQMPLAVYIDMGNAEDERRQAKLLSHLSYEPSLRVESHALGGEFIDCAIEAMTEPTPSSDYLSFYSCARREELAGSVLMTGHGADEVFGCYPWQFLEGRPLWPRYMEEHDISAFLSEQLGHEGTDSNRCESELRPGEVLQELLKDALLRIDGAFASSAIEVRNPFLDRRLTSLFYSSIKTTLKEPDQRKQLIAQLCRQQFESMGRDGAVIPRDARKNRLAAPSVFGSHSHNFVKIIASGFLEMAALARNIYSSRLIELLLKADEKFVSENAHLVWKTYVLARWYWLRGIA